MRISFGLSAALRFALAMSPATRADANSARRDNWVITTSKAACSNRRYFYSLESHAQSVNEKIYVALSLYIDLFSPRLVPTEQRCSALRARDDRQPGGPPLRKAVLQPPSLEATSAKRRNRFVGEDAVRAAAIGDKFLRGVELGEARFELAERDVHGARQMSQREFIRRPDIEDGHRARARHFQKRFARNRLEAVTIIEIAADHPIHLGNVLLGNPAQRRQEIEHGLVGERVEDELALAPSDHDPHAPHLLQVLRRVGDRQAGSLRQDLDVPLALSQLLQELEPMRMRKRF